MNNIKITTERQALAQIYWGSDEAFKDIPEKFKTLDACLVAVQRYVYAL